VTDEAIALLAPRIGTRAACAASGVPQATWYRRHRSSPAPPRPEPVPHRDRVQPRALAAAERKAILDALHSSRFADLAPDEVWAVLLDEGTYLGSVSTYYRALREAGESRERRAQATHPAAVKPELVAAGPNQVYSWDITKLHGPAKWTYYHLYVILDIYSRYAVGWMVATRESAVLAEKLISETCAKRGITRGQLSIHADRGSSMTSKPVALLLADLGVTQSHSRPHVSNDNPYSEAQLPGSGQGSHLPAPTDPDVSLSAHPARAVQPFGQYRSAQCANSRGASSLTSFSHSRALLPLRSSRLYFLCAQRIRWRSMRSQSGITLLG
jgi:putative transposase